MSGRRVHAAPEDLSGAWTAAIAGFEAALEQSGKSAATVTGYRRHVEWMATGVAAGPWVVTTAQLGAWLNSQNWSRETRRKVMVSLRTFYAWAVADGYVEFAPTAGVPRSAARRRGPEPLRLPPAWEGPIDAHLVACRAKSMSVGSLYIRKMYLRRLAEVAADPWAVTTSQLEAWLSNPEWSPETKRNARSQVRAFYRWAVRQEHVQTSPAVDLDAVRVPRAMPRPASNDAVREAMTAADDRVRLMVLLGAYAGLRRAEIASLHCNDLGPTYLVVRGKGGHVRNVPLDPDGDLAVALRAEIQRRRDRRPGPGWIEPTSEFGWLFPSSQDPTEHLTPSWVGKLIEAVLPGEFTTHQLRHRFATAAYGATRDLRAVQELLGHTKPETTALYAAVPDGALMAAVVGAGTRSSGAATCDVRGLR